MTETSIDAKAVRARLHHYLSPEVAGCIGLSLQQLQQAAIGAYPLNDSQLRVLARRMGIKEVSDG